MKPAAYIFDVDGTLTPSRGVMDLSFREYFISFAEKNPTYLITGSDRQKTFEQVGEEVYNACKLVYQCNGAEVWEKNRRVKSSNWTPSYELKHFLQNRVHHSKAPYKTGGNHIEVRTGMINVSTVGRDCTTEQREQYYKWDLQNQERENLALLIENKFSDLNAVVGGQISIDVYPKGMNKSVIANDLKDEYELHFFADKIKHGGNDYPLAMMIELGQLGKVYQVSNWVDTRCLLQSHER